MAYPIDPKNGFLRAPNPYKHDAFGHDGAVDGCARVRPHSGIDSTPRVPNCPARSVLGGRVVETGWTIYAGNYVVVAAPDGWLWLDIHMAKRTVTSGAVVAEGGQIGIVGNTGGGGSGPLAGKQGKLAIHQHTSRCRDMAAVGRIINGLVRSRRKGETSAQWATAHGLSDPYPHIIASVEDGKSNAPATGTPIEEDDMYSDTDRARDELTNKGVVQVANNVAAARVQLDRIEATLNRIETIAAQNKWALTDGTAGLRRMVADVRSGLSTVPGAGPMAKVELADGELGRIADAVADEQADRLAGKP